MIKSKTLSVVFLLTILAGCSGTNNSASTITSQDLPKESEDTSVPTLQNSMFEEVGISDITYREEITAVNGDTSNSGNLLVKFSADRYQGSLVDEDDNILAKVGYYSKNGKVTYSTNPDKNNKTVEKSSSIKWENSVYVNMLGKFDKSYFQYVKKDEYGYGHFQLKEEIRTNTSIKEAIIDNFYDSCSAFYHGGTSSSYGGNTLSKMEVLVKGGKITGFTIRYSATDSSGKRNYTEINATIENIGTTDLSDDDVCPKPYSIDDSLKTKYNNLSLALTEMKSYDYEIDVEVKKSGKLFQHSKALFNKDGYYGYDQLITGTTSGYTYYGIHKRNDGKYEKYSGTSSDDLKGTKYRTSAHQGLMTFSYQAAIFEYDSEASTSTKDVFNLRSDFISHYGVSTLTEDMTYDEYAEYASSLSLTVENGHLTSFSFPFSDNYGNNYTFVETISNHGANQSPSSEYGDFSNLVEYKLPTSYSELSVGVLSLSDGSITSYYSGDEIMSKYLFTKDSIDKLPFPIDEKNGYYFDSAVYMPEYIVPSALYFFFMPGDENINTVYNTILADLNANGYQLSSSGDTSASQTIDSTYSITLEIYEDEIYLLFTSVSSYE